MNNQKYIVGGLVLFAVIVGAWFMFAPSVSNTTDEENISTKVPEDDAVDITIGFYKSWLAAVQDATTDPYQAGLSTHDLLADSVRTYIIEAQQAEGIVNLDPVLCLLTIPEKVRAKSIFASDTSAEVQVLGRGDGEKAAEYAMVGLSAVDGAWQISSITCVSGETAPEREFAFDQEGFMVKGATLQRDPESWYLLFEENGEGGHIAPLAFDATSICVSSDGNEGACDTNSFTEPSKAHVQGGMTEAGAVVQRIEMLGT